MYRRIIWWVCISLYRHSNYGWSITNEKEASDVHLRDRCFTFSTVRAGWCTNGASWNHVETLREILHRSFEKCAHRRVIELYQTNMENKNDIFKKLLLDIREMNRRNISLSGTAETVTELYQLLHGIIRRMAEVQKVIRGKRDGRMLNEKGLLKFG